MNATRRLWARRASRAGWLLAPILAAPGASCRYIKRLCFSSFINLGWTVGLLSVIGGIGSCTTIHVLDEQDATPTEITTYLKGNWCMTELMPRRQVSFGRALTVNDLKQGKKDCAEAHERMAKIEQQKAAMEAAKK
jgi:hypothetical protein